MDNGLWRLTASELANAIATGEVGAVEVVRAHLARIATANPRVNAITNVLEESAIEAAHEVDRKRLAGHELGPLAGVPFTVKENIDVAGSPTTHGVPALTARDALGRRTRCRETAACRGYTDRPYEPPGFLNPVSHFEPALRRHD